MPAARGPKELRGAHTIHIRLQEVQVGSSSAPRGPNESHEAQTSHTRPERHPRRGNDPQGAHVSKGRLRGGTERAPGDPRGPERAPGGTNEQQQTPGGSKEPQGAPRGSSEPKEARMGTRQLE